MSLVLLVPTPLGFPAMAWFVRYTRFMDAHLVYAQEAGQSCGIASVMMTVFKINKLRPGAAALHTEKHIDKVYSKVSHTHYDGHSYTYAKHLAHTLNHLHVGSWKAENVGAANVGRAILHSLGTVSPGPVVSYSGRHKPIIVLMGWKRGGAHFVVVDTVVSWGGKLYASICDPWDGDVHVTPVHPGHTLHYTGAQVPGSWDLGGTRHTYSSPSHGGGNGWIVRHV